MSNDTPKKNSVEYFINNKVEDLIERASVEGKRRKRIEEKVVDDSVDMNTETGIEYLNSIAAEFSDFPKYVGRGIQDLAPEIDGNSLTMRFSEVEPSEIDDFIAKIVNDGFLKEGDDYVKVAGKEKLIIAISSAADKLRIFYNRVPV